MAYPTKKQKQHRAATYLHVEDKDVKTKGEFFNNDTYTRERERDLQAQGYRTEVTDAWGEMGFRGYSVVWYTKEAPKWPYGEQKKDL